MVKPAAVPFLSPFARILVVIALACAAGAALTAATPSFWQVSTQADLLKGEVVANIAIDSDGRLTLGPTNETIASTTQAALWTIVPNGQGGYFVGTGNDGEVLEIEADGRTRVVFDAEELQVHALAVDNDGRLFIGTSPDGKVYVRPRGRDSKATVFFDPAERYIWALAVASDGTLLVGTGDKAALYRVDREGKAARVFESKATHITALAPTPGGDVVVGTDSPGQVLRVAPAGKAFLLIDTGFKEVRSIKPAAGRAFFVAAMNGTGTTPSPGSGETPAEPSTTTTLTPTVTTEVVMAVVGDAAAPATPASATRKNETADAAKGAVYRLAADGLWDQIWRTADDLPYDVEALENGDLLVATAPKGKIYRVTPSPLRTTLVARANAEQAVRFAPRGPRERGHVYITANPGRIYRLGSEPAAEGTYESDVLDAGTVATWGVLRWRAQASSPDQVRISTRSGNTPRPDETWSDWSEPYSASEASAIVSPKARYLQWRVQLSGGRGPGPSLTSVTAAYLQRNIRPRVDSVTAHPAGVAFQKPFSTGEMELAGFDSGTADGRMSPMGPAATGAAGAQSPTTLGRRVYQKGVQTLVWKAQDANGDRLQFDLYYRREGEDWRLLRRGLWDEVFTWDTTSVPDGTYSVKVVASDAPSNAPELALTGELESTAFDIDNTPPVIERVETVTRGGRRLVRFRVRDAQSAIARVEYSLDATRWRFAYAVDGLADSREELFEIEVEEGATAVPIVRVTDALNNVATTAIEN